jgi:EAL domain-containing protein (putative c-di-GMP-specific phosphodiesterase class I)
MRDMVLVLDDEAMTRAGVAVAVGSTGRTVITCGDIESAQLVIERMPIRSVLTDMRLSGPFSDDGLRFIDFVTRFYPESRVVLMTGTYSPELGREAENRGAFAVLEKPFTTSQIDAVLARAESVADDAIDIIDVPQLEDVLDGSRLFSIFQPIVSLEGERESAFAYEALTRVDTAGPLRVPEFLFEYCSRKRRITDVELACVGNAIRDGATLPQHALLFVNMHPAVISERRIVDGLIAATTRHALSPGRVIIEITEQSALRDLGDSLRNIDELRAAGFRFAFDDVGMAYSHLLHTERIQPAFMKISREFGNDLHASTFKQKVVRNVLHLAGDLGCEVVLEGVEKRESLDAARALGIRYVQGFLFGYPERAAVWS